MEKSRIGKSLSFHLIYGSIKHVQTSPMQHSSAALSVKNIEEIPVFQEFKRINYY